MDIEQHKILELLKQNLECLEKFVNNEQFGQVPQLVVNCINLFKKIDVDTEELNKQFISCKLAVKQNAISKEEQLDRCKNFVSYIHLLIQDYESN